MKSHKGVKSGRGCEGITVSRRCAAEGASIFDQASPKMMVIYIYNYHYGLLPQLLTRGLSTPDISGQDLWTSVRTSCHVTRFAMNGSNAQDYSRAPIYGFISTSALHSNCPNKERRSIAPGLHRRCATTIHAA